MSLQELLVLAFLADRHVTIAQDTLYESQELEGQFEGGQAPNICFGQFRSLAPPVHFLSASVEAPVFDPFSESSPTLLVTMDMYLALTWIGSETMSSVSQYFSCCWDPAQAA